jgi:hypothetical protein
LAALFYSAKILIKPIILTEFQKRQFAIGEKILQFLAGEK